MLNLETMEVNGIEGTVSGGVQDFKINSCTINADTMKSFFVSRTSNKTHSTLTVFNIDMNVRPFALVNTSAFTHKHNTIFHSG